MANVLRWIGVALGIGVIAFGVMGFFRGLSLPEVPARRQAPGREAAPANAALTPCPAEG